MDEVTLFHYKDLDTPVHRFSPLLKIVLSLLLSFEIFYSKFIGLILLSVFIFILLKISKISIVSVLRQIKLFFILLAIIFISKSISNEGNILLKISYLKITDLGVIKGIIQSWKFLLIILTSLILTETSLQNEFKASIYYLLKPVPFLNHRKISDVAGIAFSLIPKVFDIYKNTSNALHSRNYKMRKNIFVKIKYRILPMSVNSLLMCNNLADAYIARNYSDNTNIKIPIKIQDFPIFFVLILLLISIFYIDYNYTFSYIDFPKFMHYLQ